MAIRANQRYAARLVFYTWWSGTLHSSIIMASSRRPYRQYIFRLFRSLHIAAMLTIHISFSFIQMILIPAIGKMTFGDSISFSEFYFTRHHGHCTARYIASRRRHLHSGIGILNDLLTKLNFINLRKCLCHISKACMISPLLNVMVSSLLSVMKWAFWW